MSRKTDIPLETIDDLASKLINYGKESKEKDHILCQIINWPLRNISFTTHEKNAWCFEIRSETKIVAKIHCESLLYYFQGFGCRWSLRICLRNTWHHRSSTWKFEKSYRAVWKSHSISKHWAWNGPFVWPARRRHCTDHSFKSVRHIIARNDGNVESRIF